jgi:hypothetical protein
MPAEVWNLGAGRLPPRRRRALLALALSVTLGVCLVSAVRYPIFDDEGFAIAHALSGFGEILRGGLGATGQFHPPLSEVVLHAWLLVSGAHSTIAVRLPAIAFWLGALAALFWALGPIASDTERLTAVAVAGVWPAHLLLPVAATWYSAAALFGIVAFGALLRALSVESPKLSPLILAGAAIVALAYTVFAWPFVVLAEALGLALLVGPHQLLRRSRALLILGVAVALLVAPAMLAIRSRVGPMLHRGAGGGPLQTLGAGVALVAGHSAPAIKVTAVIVIAVSLALATRLADRRARALLTITAVALCCLAATNTLNDKRLLLASPFLPAALAMGVAGRTGRRALVICVLAAVPAWMGWLGVTSTPWIFPRWQDPLAELIRIHRSSATPRLLLTSEPPIALTAAFARGDTRPWDDPSASQGDASSVQWRIQSAGRMLRNLSLRENAGDDPFATIDLIAPSRKVEATKPLTDALATAGWRMAEDRAFGRDPFSEIRHHDADPTRLHLIRFTRLPRPAP